MTLHSLDVEGYQSLRNVHIELGGFTVVTGATGSGKSSLGRALKLIVSNARGTGYISQGMKTCKAALAFHWNNDQPAAVGIERGGRGSDLYRLTVSQLGEPYTQEFTKLGGKVPDEITSLLALGDVNFAGQFERPFLLDETGGEAAKTLGRLTNVTLIFEAAREADRRKKEVARDLRNADAEVARLQEEARRFAGLRERIASVESAEVALAAAQATEARVKRLNGLLGTYSDAEAARGAIVVPQVPDASRLEELDGQRNRLLALLGQWDQAMMAESHWQAQAEGHGAQVEALHAELSETLHAAGVCPTCERPF